MTIIKVSNIKMNLYAIRIHHHIRIRKAMYRNSTGMSSVVTFTMTITLRSTTRKNKTKR